MLQFHSHNINKVIKVALKNLNKLIAPAAVGMTAFGYTMYCALGVAAKTLFFQSLKSDNLAGAAVGGFLDLGLDVGFVVYATGFAAFAGVSSYALCSTYKLISDKKANTMDECKKACVIVGTGALAAICGAPLIVGMPLVAVAAIASEALVGK